VAVNLTKNERKVLQLLLENARMSDSAIAKKLKISSQAIGKIRKKLEASVITAYTTNLNYSKLGIKTFAISLAKLTAAGLDKGEIEMEQTLLEDPNIIQVFRLPSNTTTHIILYGFRDLTDLDLYFHSHNKKKDIHQFLEHRDIYTFSCSSLLKNDPTALFKKIISEDDDAIDALTHYMKRNSP
jgi:DNA-binding Lrp family transcriptional regulator